MNILFVTGNDYENGLSGGGLGSKRIYNLLCRYGEVDVFKITKRSNFRSLLSVLQGYFPPLDHQYIKSFNDILDQNKYKFVFIEDSSSGELIRSASKKIKTINIFNNCEVDYIDVRFGNRRGLKWKIYKKLVSNSERLTCQYSNCMLALSIRDADRIQKVYHRRPDELLPLTLIDTYHPIENMCSMDEKGCVLFGPAEQANIEGFEWFIKHVSPYIECKSIVCGKGFEAYKDRWTSDKVEIVGYVPETRDAYSRAYCIAIPLFSGGGMKIKTAEALMFGKYIFGTEEAFSGYDFDENQVGGRCNTAEEFITGINTFLSKIKNSGDINSSSEIFNNYSRRVYEEKYSIESSKRIMDSILTKMELIT